MTTRLCYGIPDIVLPKLNGGEVNPSVFAGHEFVIFFCPADAGAAAVEIKDYCAHANTFADRGAWLIGVLSGEPSHGPSFSGKGPHILLAHDKDGHAWAAFEELLGAEERSGERDGGTFLFDRGGCLAKAWAGSGHAEDVLEALRWRA